MHDDALAKLDNLPSLKHFASLRQPHPGDAPQITERAVSMLKRYPKLRGLNLRCVKISDDGFAKLFSSPEMQNLESLQLGGTIIGEKGLEAAAKLPRLLDLRFEGCTNTTTAALAHLQDSTVESLNFYSATMSPDRLAEIAKIPHLKGLVLGPNGFTLQQLALFAGHPELDSMSLIYTGFDQEGLDRIPEFLPGFAAIPDQPDGIVLLKKTPLR